MSRIDGNVYVDVMKKEREDKSARQKVQSKRKRLPKRDPINSKI